MTALTKIKTQKLRKNLALNTFEGLCSRKVVEITNNHNHDMHRALPIPEPLVLSVVSL